MRAMWFGLVLLTGAAQAMTFCWDMPTERIAEDGSLQPFDAPSEGAGYQAYCADNKRGPFLPEAYFTGGATTQGEVARDHGYCRLTIIDMEGKESALSNTAGKPAPPAGAIFHFGN